MTRLVLLLLLATALGACRRVGPGHVRPEPVVPDTWRTSLASAENVADTAWWRQFDDPVLDRLIQRALSENLDVRVAAARIQGFAARVRIARAGMLPQLNYEASAERLGPSTAQAYGLPPGISPDSASDLFAAITASWELDVWGRIRSETAAARADLLASAEGRRAVIMTLVSTVAGSYVGLRALDQQLEIANATADSLGQTAELFRVQTEGGLKSDMEVAQAESEHERALVSATAVKRQIAVAENALSILLGSNPEPIDRGRTLGGLGVPRIPAGLPSTLLQRRPDIRAAEQDLAAAAADVRVARAAFYPRIALTGALGTASRSLSDAFTSDATLWSFGASVIGPIFRAGELRGQLTIARAAQKELLLTYLRTVQEAFREVEDALISVARTREELAQQDRRVAALEEYLRLGQLRFDEGLISFIEVLDATRRLFEARLMQAQTTARLYRSIVDTYEAMGGGWVCRAEEIANAAERARPEPCLRRCLPECPSPRPPACVPRPRTAAPPPPPPLHHRP